MVASYAPVEFVTFLLVEWILDEDRSEDLTPYTIAPFLFFLSIFFLMHLLRYALLCFYVVARFVLIVEALISLPYSPDPVFQQPSWLAYFPHIN